MQKKKIVVALGGNAIQTGDGTAHAQQKGLEKTAIQLAKLIKKGYELVITHGNGPQVGKIYKQQMASESPHIPAMPLDTCGAMSQGMIGYWLQNAIDLRLKELLIPKPLVSLVTRVEVDPADPAFFNPVKPIGSFYTEEEAKNLMKETGEEYVEDANRGWRKVVPSPAPIKILEHQAIKTLMDHGHVVICAGGGGVPVIHRRGRYIGVEVVIDKDFASQKLAEEINADILLMLTEVDHAYINFNSPEEEALHEVGTKEMEKFLKEGHFAPGSMLPKIRAGIDFAESAPDRECIITSLDKAVDALEGNTGTKIVKQTVKHGEDSIVSI
jgi:carbamate kinase